MPGTRREPLRRPAVQQISARAVEIYAELRRAARARRRAADCSVSRHGHCNAECAACRAWWDAHDALCTEIRLPPWQWPCVGRCPFPPGSPRARKWRPGGAQRELQEKVRQLVEIVDEGERDSAHAGFAD